MLGTRDRTLLLESLRPPPGLPSASRRGDQLHAGSDGPADRPHSLSLSSTPTTTTACGDRSRRPARSAKAARRERHAFCQAGRSRCRDRNRRCWPTSRVPSSKCTHPARKGSSTPKLWVLAFEADEAPAVYRMLCLSRNLTFARSWDTCLSLEGQLMNRQRGYSRNKPLADLLLALPGLATRPDPRRRA